MTVSVISNKTVLSGVQPVTDSSGYVSGFSGGPTNILPPRLVQRHTAVSSKIMPTSANPAGFANDATNGKVSNQQITALAPFYGVKLIYANYSTSVTIPIDGAWVAPSGAGIPAGTAPGNSSLTWTGVTFSGSTSGIVPVAVTNVTRPVPGYLVSDFIPLKSIARTDNISLPPILRVATHNTASSNNVVVPGRNGTKETTFNSLNVNNCTANPGLATASYQFVAALGSSITGSQTVFTGQYDEPVGAIFYYSTGVLEVTFHGDSILAGDGSTTTYAGFGEYLTFMTYGTVRPISSSGWAMSGEKTVDTLAIMKGVFSKFKPDYAVFKAWSPNDGYTQAIADTSWGYCLEMVEVCRQNGVTPVVLTHPPSSGMAWSVLQTQNSRVLSLPKFVITVDVASSINDPNSPGNMIASYDSGDHVHLNDLGNNLVASLINSSLPS